MIFVLVLTLLLIGMAMGLWIMQGLNKPRVVGNLVLIDDPDDDQTYIFLEITKGNLQYIKEQQIVGLKVEKRKPRK